MGIFKRNNSRKIENPIVEDKAAITTTDDCNINVDSNSMLDEKINLIKKESKNITDCITALLDSTSTLQTSSNMQLNELSTVSKKLDNFNSNIEELALDITNVHIKALDADKLADSGLTAINELDNSLAHLESAFNSSSETVNQLVKKLESVNSITDSISHIATQTNLLSLNAAIEAARAGEAGRGFSVVAGEVGKLAENSKSAVQNITSILAEIKKDILLASKAMESGTSSIVSQHNSLNSAKSNFSEIKTSIVDEVNDINTSITNLTSAYAQKDDIISSVSNAKNVAEENSDLINDLISIINKQQTIINSLTSEI